MIYKIERIENNFGGITHGTPHHCTGRRPDSEKVCRPVTKFDDRLGTLLDDMKETLLDANGLGLAGPQVGMMRRLFICLDDRDLPEEVP